MSRKKRLGSVKRAVANRHASLLSDSALVRYAARPLVDWIVAHRRNAQWLLAALIRGAVCGVSLIRCVFGRVPAHQEAPWSDRVGMEALGSTSLARLQVIRVDAQEHMKTLHDIMKNQDTKSIQTVSICATASGLAFVGAGSVYMTGGAPLFTIVILLDYGLLMLFSVYMSYRSMMGEVVSHAQKPDQYVQALISGSEDKELVIAQINQASHGIITLGYEVEKSATRGENARVWALDITIMAAVISAVIAFNIVPENLAQYLCLYAEMPSVIDKAND